MNEVLYQCFACSYSATVSVMFLFSARGLIGSDSERAHPSEATSPVGQWGTEIFGFLIVPCRDTHLRRKSQRASRCTVLVHHRHTVRSRNIPCRVYDIPCSHLVVSFTRAIGCLGYYGLSCCTHSSGSLGLLNLVEPSPHLWIGSSRRAHH